MFPRTTSEYNNWNQAKVRERVSIAQENLLKLVENVFKLCTMKLELLLFSKSSVCISWTCIQMFQISMESCRDDLFPKFNSFVLIVIISPHNKLMNNLYSYMLIDEYSEWNFIIMFIIIILNNNFPIIYFFLYSYCYTDFIKGLFDLP